MTKNSLTQFFAGGGCRGLSHLIPEHDRDTVSQPDKMKKIGGGVIFSGEQVNDPKKIVGRQNAIF